MANEEEVKKQIETLKIGIKTLDKVKIRAQNLYGYAKFIESVQIVNDGISQIINDYEQKIIDSHQFMINLESFSDNHTEDYLNIAKTADLPHIIKKISNKNKLESIEAYLAKLLLKINEYKSKSGTQEFELAYHATENIYNGLNALSNQKKAKKCTLEEFKTQAIDFLNSQQVKEDIKTLDTPRGWKAKTIVLNIMIALTMLIVGYPIFLLANKGFFKPNTDGGNIVNDLSRECSGLEL
jgi:hypothetical protein